MHEYLAVEGISELKTPYIHYNYESISQFIQKMDALYSENEVDNLIRVSYQFSWFDAIRFLFQIL